MKKLLKVFPCVTLPMSIISVFFTLNGYSVTGFVLSFGSCVLAILYWYVIVKVKRGDYDE